MGFCAVEVEENLDVVSSSDMFEVYHRQKRTRTPGEVNEIDFNNFILKTVFGQVRYRLKFFPMEPGPKRRDQHAMNESFRDRARKCLPVDDASKICPGGK